MKYGDIQLLPNSKLYNLCVESLSSDPEIVLAELSRIYFNTTSNTYKFNNGVGYVDLSLPANFSSLISTLGTSWINSDFTFNPTLLNGFHTVSGLTSNNSLYDVLFQMDQAISHLEAPALADLTDVNVPGTLASGDILYWNNNQYTFATIDTLIENFSTIKVETLKNVNSTTLPNGGSLVYNSAQQQYNVIQTSVVIEDFFNTTQHSISHNLGIKYVAVTVIDAQTDQTIPSATIQYIDVNSLNITLSTAAKVIVILTVPYGFND